MPSSPVRITACGHPDLSRFELLVVIIPHRSKPFKHARGVPCLHCMHPERLFQRDCRVLFEPSIRLCEFMHTETRILTTPSAVYATYRGLGGVRGGGLGGRHLLGLDLIHEDISLGHFRGMPRKRVLQGVERAAATDETYWSIARRRHSRFPP